MNTVKLNPWVKWIRFEVGVQRSRGEVLMMRIEEEEIANGVSMHEFDTQCEGTSSMRTAGMKKSG